MYALYIVVRAREHAQLDRAPKSLFFLFQGQSTQARRIRTRVYTEHKLFFSNQKRKCVPHACALACTANNFHILVLLIINARPPRIQFPCDIESTPIFGFAQVCGMR